MAASWKRLKRHHLSAERGDITGRRWKDFVDLLREHGNVDGRKVTIHEGKIVDGWQLYRGCLEADVKPEFIVLRLKKGLTIEKWLKAKNYLRRQETEAEEDERIGERQERVAEARSEGKSLRTIAEEEGIAVGTVVSDIKASTVQGRTVEPAKIQGKDARTYQNSSKSRTTPVVLCDRCKRTGAAKDCPNCAEARKPKSKAKPAERSDADEDAPEVTDAEGVKVPEHAIAAFAAADALTAICRELDGFLKRAEEIAKGPGGRLIRFESFKQQIKDAKGNLWANRATHVCPYCHGKPKAKTCECCKGEGWTSKTFWQAAPGTNGKAQP